MTGYFYQNLVIYTKFDSFELKFILMQKYQKPKFTYKDLGKNPCVSSLEVPVKTLVMKHQFQQDKDDNTLVNVEIQVEALHFSRIYVTSERRKLVSALSMSAKELYLWIMYEIETGEDALWINKDRFMEENNTSLNTFKKAVEELVRYAFIAYTIVKEVYWINPDFFFKGDRMKKYPKNIVIS